MPCSRTSAVGASCAADVNPSASSAAVGPARSCSRAPVATAGADTVRATGATFPSRRRYTGTTTCPCAATTVDVLGAVVAATVDYVVPWCGDEDRAAWPHPAATATIASSGSSRLITENPADADGRTRAPARPGRPRSGAPAPVRPLVPRSRGRSPRAGSDGARDGDAGRFAVTAHGAAEGVRRTGLRLLHGLREPQGNRARGESARGAALLLGSARPAGPDRRTGRARRA